MKHGDIVLVKIASGQSKKAKINWIKDGDVGISYLDKDNLGTGNVVNVSDITLVKESRGFKYNDIVSAPKGKARINWVENGDVGITYLSPAEVKGAASVVKELELHLISASAKDKMAERIASITDDELAKNIMNIRGRRHPQPTVRRVRKGNPKIEREKKVSFDELFKKIDENPNK